MLLHSWQFNCKLTEISACRVFRWPSVPVQIVQDFHFLLALLFIIFFLNPLVQLQNNDYLGLIVWPRGPRKGNFTVISTQGVLECQPDVAQCRQELKTWGWCFNFKAFFGRVLFSLHLCLIFEYVLFNLARTYNKLLRHNKLNKTWNTTYLFKYLRGFYFYWCIQAQYSI